jgi:flagellar protein FlaJ
MSPDDSGADVSERSADQSDFIGPRPAETDAFPAATTPETSQDEAEAETDDSQSRRSGLWNKLSDRVGILESSADDEDDDTYGYHSDPVSLSLDRIAYALFGYWFRGQDERFFTFNRKLNQARIPISYDIYLSRATFYSLTVGAVGAALGILLGLLFGDYITAIESGISFPTTVGLFIEQYKRTLVSLSATIVLGSLGFISTFAGLYYYPSYVASERKREINALLPHAVTFMYAMSRGGVNIVEVIRALSEAEDSYGAVAVEMRAVINNVDFVKEDLRSAIIEESQETPSEDMQDLFEDILNVIDTGSDMEQFFLNKSEIYMDKARKQQENTLETLEILSEVYVTLFVASPIFILVILVVLSLLGAADIALLYGMTYFGIPMGGAFFSAFIMLISVSGTKGHAVLERSGSANPWNIVTVDTSSIADDARYKKYNRIKQRQEASRRIVEVFSIIRQKPAYSLVLTLPVVAAWIAYLATSGLATFSVEGMLNAPVWQTLVLVYIPMLMSLGVFSIIHELKARRENKILSRLPEAFKGASDANERGLTIKESFRIVAKNSGGTLAGELEEAINESTWTGSLNDALVQFANSMKVSRLSRTIKLITKANEASGDVQSVLRVAARDVENMYKLEESRKQNAYSYIAVIAVSFLVSLFVIVMLDVNFLSTFAQNPAFSGDGQGVPGGLGGGGGGGIPVREFRMAFLHTTMVLGGASGIVAGTMANRDPLSGIKYSLVMMGIALAVFGAF